MENQTVDIRSESLSILGTLKEAWRLVRGLKLQIFLLTVVFAILFSVVLWLVTTIAGSPFPIPTGTEGETSQEVVNTVLVFSTSGILFLVLTGVVTWFYTSAVTLLGVKQATGKPGKVSEVFKECFSKGSCYWSLMVLVV